MKRTTAFFLGAALAAGLALGSCSLSDALKGLAAEQEKPTLSFDSVSIKSLDTEGITFKCNYSVSNPYSVGISLAGVTADISCNDSKLTSLNANEGVTIAANNSASNVFDFKVPYDSVLSFAKTYQESKVLPFLVKGTVSLDKLPVISTLTIPFSKDFEVPVFKPSFSLSSPKLVMPSVTEIAAALVKGGKTNALKAASLAKSLVTGGKVEDEGLLDGIDLNMKLNFDLGVKNEGGSAWRYSLNSCGIRTEGGGDLIALDASGDTTVEAESATIPLSATLNTLKAGKFIMQLINKSGANPTFALDSGLSFPGLPYEANLPLAYSREIPLSGVTRTSN